MSTAELIRRRSQFFKLSEYTYSLTEISDDLCGELYGDDGWITKYSKYPNWLEDIKDTEEE